MIDFKEAMQMINTDALKQALKITKCVDIGDRYAFYVDLKDAKPDQPTPGLPILCVNKETREITEMTIPPIENLQTLLAGKEIEIQG